MQAISLCWGVGKIHWRRKWQPIPVSLPEKSRRQRSLAGHSPLGRKELDTTKHEPRGSDVRKLPAMQETQVWSLGQEDPLEKGMATNSSTLAWRIPWTGEPDRPWATVYGVAKSRTQLSDWQKQQALTSLDLISGRFHTDLGVEGGYLGIFLKRMINYTELVEWTVITSLNVFITREVILSI